MLLELSIRNFAIIRDLRIQFSPGFNALTGETGAGKSIIIDALGAVLGARVSADLVRSGASSAWVEATFDVTTLAQGAALHRLATEAGVDLSEGTLILARDINATGRSTARINGRSVTAGVLASFGALLVDIHGQTEHLSLLRPALHLDLLDRFAGTEAARAELATLVRQFSSIQRELDEILTGARERAQRVDLLRFQSEEIATAQLQPDEEERMSRERDVLANADRLARLAAEAYQVLEGGDELSAEPTPGALDQVRLAVDRVEEIARLDPSAESLASQLREALFLLEDCGPAARGYADAIESDPTRLAAIEDRLALIRQLKRKYGETVDEIIAYADQIGDELYRLDSSEERLDELRQGLEELRGQIGQRAARLSEQRRASASELERRVENAMTELNMGRALFVVHFDRLSTDQTTTVQLDGQEQTAAFDASGIDRVEFLIAPNAGETPRPLARIASGGETARLMLALKSILSEVDETPTLIFDEIDVGVGGRSGQPVGEKLWSLGSRHQVIVISHLPQIAAFAEAHHRITKLERDGRTETRVDRLDADERVDELAAMLDGLPVTPQSRGNAAAMLTRIEQWKQDAVGPARVR